MTSCHHVSRASVSRIGAHPMRWTEKAMTAMPRASRTSLKMRMLPADYNFRATAGPVWRPGSPYGKIRGMRAIVRRHVLSQAGALLGAAGVLLTAYVILAIDAAQHRLLPFDRNVREWVQPMRGGGLDLSMESV